MVSELRSRTTDRLVLKLTHHLFRVRHPTDGQIFQWKGSSLKPSGKTVGFTHPQEIVKEIYQDRIGDLKEISIISLKNLELMNFQLRINTLLNVWRRNF